MTSSTKRSFQEIPASSSGNHVSPHKKAKHYVNCDSLGNDNTTPHAQVVEHEYDTEHVSSTADLCIMVSEQEWQSILRGARMLLRPYQCQGGRAHGELALATRIKDGYYVVGSFKVEGLCEDTTVDKVTNDVLKDIYSQRELRNLRQRSKSLWIWKLADVCPVSEPLAIPWINHNGRNRPFKIDVQQLRHPSKAAKCRDHCPRSLSLAETAKFYFHKADHDFQQLFTQQLRKLSGRKLRVGTTCSGCDICVTVLKQTVDHFNATQDSSQCSFYLYIYKYIYIYYIVYIYKYYLNVYSHLLTI